MLDEEFLDEQKAILIALAKPVKGVSEDTRIRMLYAAQGMAKYYQSRLEGKAESE